MRVISAIILSLLVGVVVAIFQDQVGVIDWRQRFLNDNVHGERGKDEVQLTAELVPLPKPAYLERHYQAVPGVGLIENIVQRWKFHWDQLVIYSQWIGTENSNANITSPKQVDSGTSGDRFGLHQMIIAVSNSGKVRGVHSETSNVQWVVQMFPTSIKDAWICPQQDNESSRHRVRIVMKGSDKEAFTSIIDYVSGEMFDQRSFNLNVNKVVCSQDGLRIITEDGKVEVVGIEAPQSVPVNTFYLQNQSSTLYGVRIEGNKDLVNTWKYQLPSESVVAQVTTRKYDEAISSIGLVLGNRSVLYKYLNPNIVAVLSHDKKQRLSVDILDGVSGRLLYQAVHDNFVPLGNSVHVALSENWIVYSFAGNVGNQNCMTLINVLELYESDKVDVKMSESGQFSPYSAPSPHVKSESFVFEQFASALGITQTKSGITLRDIIVATNGGQVITLPKLILNARRPHKLSSLLTAEEKEEGLTVYAPLIPDNPQNYLSHNLRLEGIRKIVCGHTDLESTSIVVAYGTDMFKTLVTPSKVFDVLGPEFSKSSLLLTMLVLAVGTVAAKQYASRRKLYLEWR
ncbi:hypothetical protein MP228_009545 [Amoeboaphelidium protococcarum]|nr:hypothetical protein MP228_009545 [Amoeboaphelidium protococcarum]